MSNLSVYFTDLTGSYKILFIKRSHIWRKVRSYFTLHVLMTVFKITLLMSQNVFIFVFFLNRLWSPFKRRGNECVHFTKRGDCQSQNQVCVYYCAYNIIYKNKVHQLCVWFSVFRFELVVSGGPTLCLFCILNKCSNTLISLFPSSPKYTSNKASETETERPHTTVCFHHSSRA